MTDDKKINKCSFCGKVEHEVRLLIGGIGDACICNECVGGAAGMLFESEGWQRVKLADAQLAESVEADFAAAEWTFRLRPGYRVSAGRFLIVPIAAD